MTLYAVFEDGLELDAEFQPGEDMSADFGDVTEIATEQYRFGYGLKYDPDGFRGCRRSGGRGRPAPGNLRRRPGANRKH